MLIYLQLFLIQNLLIYKKKVKKIVYSYFDEYVKAFNKELGVLQVNQL